MSHTPRTGRPPDFETRQRIVLYLDAKDLARVQAAARAERISVSKYARQAILAAVLKRKRRTAK